MHKILRPKPGYQYRLVKKDKSNSIALRNAGWSKCTKDEFKPEELEDITWDGSYWVNRSRTSLLMKISDANMKDRNLANRERATTMGKPNRKKGESIKTKKIKIPIKKKGESKDKKD